MAPVPRRPCPMPGCSTTKYGTRTIPFSSSKRGNYMLDYGKLPARMRKEPTRHIDLKASYDTRTTSRTLYVDPSATERSSNNEVLPRVTLRPSNKYVSRHPRLHNMPRVRVSSSPSRPRVAVVRGALARSLPRGRGNVRPYAVRVGGWVPWRSRGAWRIRCPVSTRAVRGAGGLGR